MMRKLAIGLTLIAAMASSLATAQTTTVRAGTAPGMAAAAEKQSYTGTISAIDRENRKVTVSGESGRTVEVNAGPEVKNFDQLKTGDRVTLEFVRALGLELHKGSTAAVSRKDEADAVGAKTGQIPEGAIGTKTTIMAEVAALDPATRTVTLKGPNRSVELEVEDAKLFSNLAVGDRVEATYIEAVAFSVTPAPSP